MKIIKFFIFLLIGLFPIASIASGSSDFSANNNFFGYTNNHLILINKSGVAYPTNYAGTRIISLIYGKGEYLIGTVENHLYQSINGIEWARVPLTVSGVRYLDFNTTRIFYSQKYHTFFTTDDHGTRYSFCFSSNATNWTCQNTPFASLDGNNLSYVHYCNGSFYRFGQQEESNEESNDIGMLVATSTNGFDFRTFFLPDDMMRSSCVGSNVYFYQKSGNNNVFYQYNTNSGHFHRHIMSQNSDIQGITGNSNDLVIYGYSLGKYNGKSGSQIMIDNNGKINIAETKELFDIRQNRKSFIGMYEGTFPNTFYFSHNGMNWQLVK